jgi:hypothetical protein
MLPRHIAILTEFQIDNTVIPDWNMKKGGPFDDADIEPRLELVTR